MACIGPAWHNRVRPEGGEMRVAVHNPVDGLIGWLICPGDGRLILQPAPVPAGEDPDSWALARARLLWREGDSLPGPDEDGLRDLIAAHPDRDLRLEDDSAPLPDGLPPPVDYYPFSSRRPVEEERWYDPLGEAFAALRDGGFEPRRGGRQ
jgi:hypothetical protein